MNKVFSVFYNRDKKQAVEALKEFQNELKKSGAEILLEKITPETDVVVAVGGDGTLLRTARSAVESEKPVAYINVGTFGFLGSRPGDTGSFASRIVAGNFSTETRMLLEARLKKEVFTALNDIVVKNGATARVIELEIYVDGILLGNLKGDGVIVSTPTGSTAYSLAAGGPVLCPELETIVITPLNPHSLNSRSVVVPSWSSLTVRTAGSSGREVIMTADGQDSRNLKLPAEVEIVKHSKVLELISGEDSFFGNLSSALNWGGRRGKGIKNGN